MEGDCDRSPSGADIELAQDILDMGVHGSLPDEECRRDFGVRLAFGHELQYLALTPGQASGLAARRRR